VDGGANWTHATVESGTGWCFSRIFLVDAGAGFAVGGIKFMEADTVDALVNYSGSPHAMGALFRTRDSGRTWQEMSAASQYPSVFGHPTAWLTGLYFYDRLRGWVCGPFGNIFRTVDGGDSWEQMAATGYNMWVWDSSGISYQAISFPDGVTGYMVGEDSVIMKSTNGGANWTFQSGQHRVSLPLVDSLNAAGRRLYNYFRDVFFLNTQTGWAVGDNACIMKTVNAGATWIPQPISLPATLTDLLDIKQVFFLNADTGWAVAHLSGGILRTRNGGTSWEWIKTGINGWFNAIHFSDYTHGWAVGEAGQIIFSADGGSTWTLQRGLSPNAGSLAPILVVHAHGDDEVIWGTGALAAKYALNSHLPVVTLRATFDDMSPTKRHGEPKKLELRSAHTVLGYCGQLTLDEFDTQNKTSHALQVAYWGGSEDVMERQIVEAIRTWKPAVVVTHDTIWGEYNSQNHKSVGIIATKAYHAAGNASAYPELITGAGLAAWTPQKLYYSDTTKTAPYFEVNLMDTVKATKFTFRDHAWRAMNNYISQAPATHRTELYSFYRFRRVASSVTSPSIENDILAGTAISVRTEQPGLPKAPAAMLHGFPNPFRSGCTITLAGWSAPRPVSVRIYDVNGALRETLTFPAAAWSRGVVWRPARRSQGLYVVTVTAGNRSLSQKILLVK
jgi:photosystem II stability/assembly factor-like uncharacterized protein/LmbE family N-acetylglucosaminyl deacetylase